MALLDVVTAGATDYSVTIRIVDDTDGTPETGVAFNTTGIDLWYRRPGSAHTSITEATQTEGGAHTDGGFVHISDGNYRLDLPDAAVASGVDYVDIGGTVTGMVVIGGRVRIASATRGLAGTALPNAAADAAGGLPVSDAGGLDLDAKIGALTFTTANQLDANVQYWNGTEVTTPLETSSDLVDALPSTLISTTIATLASQTSFTLTAGSADDDAYNDAIVVVTDQSTGTQKAVGSVSDYTGSTRTVTLAADPGIFTMATGDTVQIIAALGSAGSAPSAAAVADAVLAEAVADHSGTAGSLAERISRIPNAAAGGNGGLPTVNASNYVAGIQGTLNTLDALDTAQDSQHSTTQAAITALNDVSVADILTTQMTESYAADGTAPTLAQALFLIQQSLGDFAISGTTLTVRQLDGSTAAATFTLNDGSTPTAVTRAT